MNQHAYMTAIRLALNQRTGRSWSVRPGRATSHAKIYITSPSERKHPEHGTQMSREDRVLLAEALDRPVGLIVDMAVIMPDDYADTLVRIQRE